MTDNIVTSEDVYKNTKPKKAAKKNENPVPEIVQDERNSNEVVAKSPDGYKFVWFDSGSSYTLSNGFRFTKERRIYLLKNELADELLQLNNFRLPTHLELQQYASEF